MPEEMAQGCIPEMIEASTDLVSQPDPIWKDQLLMDYQGGNVELGAAEKNIMDLVTRVVAGSVIIWCSFNELMSEIAAYKSRRDRKVS